MNFKRRHYRSSTMKKCSICGSQRRIFGAGDMKTQARLKVMDRELKQLSP